MKRYCRVYCPRCEALAINNTACHETGCPNSKQKWEKRGRGDKRHLIPQNEDSPKWLQE